MADYYRTIGPTPNGGDYSEIYFLNKNGKIVDESKATKCVIRECKADGTLVSETFGECRPEKE